jgi:hypothetical protein
MKRILYLVVLILFLATGLLSCKKDKADAPAPVEGLAAHAGRNRAEVEFEVPSDAKSGKVFYGSGNFEEFTVTDATALQKVIVEELSEQEQTIRVVTMNGDSIVSNPRAVKVKVYGTNYESGLKPRKWADQVTNSATSLQFQFDNAVAGETGVRVVFTNTSGAKDSVLMKSALNMIEVNNIDTTKPYYYYSVHKPEADAIDDFFSTSVDLKTALMLDFKKAGWRIAGVSGEETGYVADNIIDNNSNTSWHSQASGAFPHWVTIDMVNPKFIDGFYYINYPGNGNGAKNVKFEISNDNTNWTTVLQTEVGESYLRQRLELSQTVVGRYLKISVLGSRNIGATQTEFAEIDAYNIQNVSADNGYLKSTPVALVNAKAPFTGDGSNPFPALGAYRMQKVAGWTHSSNAVVSYDNNGTTFSLFIAPVWGLGPVTNGKVYQTVNLQTGHYLLKIQAGKAVGPADAYGVVSSGGSLPDYTTVASAANTIKYVDLVENQNKTVELLIIVTDATTVNIGVVYNLRDQYGATGTPWTSFNLNGFELSKVE